MDLEGLKFWVTPVWLSNGWVAYGLSNSVLTKDELLVHTRTCIALSPNMRCGRELMLQTSAVTFTGSSITLLIGWPISTRTHGILNHTTNHLFLLEVSSTAAAKPQRLLTDGLSTVHRNSRRMWRQTGQFWQQSQVCCQTVRPSLPQSWKELSA